MSPAAPWQERDDISVRTRLRGASCPIHPDHIIGLVGEAPGPNTRSDCPFYPYPPSSAAGRLLALLGWTRSDYLLTFARMNMLAEWPGPRFPVARARECVPKVAELMAPRPMLLMGRGVAQAFGFGPDHPHLELTVLRGSGPSVRVAVVPHTSGRNLWYNDPDNRAAVRAFVTRLRDQELRARQLEVA